MLQSMGPQRVVHDLATEKIICSKLYAVKIGKMLWPRTGMAEETFAGGITVLNV